MFIDDKLKKIKQYFISLRYSEGITFVDMQFEASWEVPSSKIIKAQGYPNEKGHFVFYSEREDIVVDDIITYIEEIVQINIDREQKVKLLHEKIADLRKFFIDNDLDSLKRMEFVIPTEDFDYDNFPVGLPIKQKVVESEPIQIPEHIEEISSTNDEFVNDVIEEDEMEDKMEDKLTN